LQWNYFFRKELSIKKRAEVLLLPRIPFVFAVAGTMVETTSSILGHILYECGVDVTAFIGGIVENYNSNLEKVKQLQL
jgi:UDP-N-acetylmuramate--alanine ligase